MRLRHRAIPRALVPIAGSFVLLVGLFATSLSSPASVAAATSTKVAACDGVRLRTGPSTSRGVKVSLAKGAKVTVVAEVSGSTWNADCTRMHSGRTWYRISAVNGQSVASKYGVRYLYGARGLFRFLAVADPLGRELMRLIALDRKALGKSTLTVDARLVALAHNKAFTCPTNRSMTLLGRAQDMAKRQYFSHWIPSCRKSDGTLYRGTDILVTLFGQPTRRSEIIHWNNYRLASATYHIGCSLSGTNCHGTTPTVNRVEIAQRSFMSSYVHRTAELGDYTRFGCGSAKTVGTNKTYFACFFTKGLPTP